MTEIKTIVFDLGGVLIDWDPRNLYRQLFDDEKEMESFLKDICHLQWNAQMDAGRSFQEAVDELSDQYPHYREEIQAYWHRWLEMIPGQIDGTVALLNQIAQKDYQLLALTNWSAETLPLVMPDYPFFDHFEGIVVSGEEKLVKPDPKFYQVLLDRYQVKAEEALFIDDNADNIAAAAELGFPTIHFKNPEELAQRLQNLGIL
ncbi:HAD family hydrolase [Marinoscillum furvescens]|uniref:2-haloacid dehalogenase n=1 Tax=Marinoscillum furvescens DSM 4134 TaxID=1122208 RepID=A0A3D9L676_MARFU|nr:HAD family phosphatase [Marinoscillum furvescens]REE01604.1 2-haloacid dehalogenase [Marinoscillum furvescens DSM 4134]